MWPDALRVCKEYLPNKLDQLRDECEYSGLGELYLIFSYKLLSLFKFKIFFFSADY